MKFFLDSAEIQDIEKWVDFGFVDGVTTNPSLIAKSGRKIHEVIKEIADLIPHGPVSAEVTAIQLDGMMKEAHHLAKIAPNVVIKVPLTPDGLKACRRLSQEGIAVNVTLCFSAAQALLAAKAGASFISPFIGRLDDISFDGLQLVEEICDVYGNYDFETEILVASVRHTLHVVDAARLGAHIVTMPPKVLDQMFKHPLTDNGLAAFLKDWEATGQRIL